MKFIALAFSLLLSLSMPANANEARTFNAMVALANKGDAEAQYHVGMMHNNGIGTQQDPKQAFEWFQKSTASGDPRMSFKSHIPSELAYCRCACSQFRRCR